MIAERKDLVLSELLCGTGAQFGASVRHDGIRRSLRIWFEDLDVHNGPVAELRPFGLRGHQVRIFFGRFAGPVIAQIKEAADEDVQLARALVSSIRPNVVIDIPGQDLSTWAVNDGTFRLTATIRDQAHPHSDIALAITCREVIVPLLAAMAELIGYDLVSTAQEHDESVFEGALLQSIVQRRERNPRNRLLCLRMHGDICKACGVKPTQIYGKAGAILEVHHLQPLCTLDEPRAYDPILDLVPLCPSCHRAAHTRRPVPYAPEELRKLMNVDHD